MLTVLPIIKDKYFCKIWCFYFFNRPVITQTREVPAFFFLFYFFKHSSYTINNPETCFLKTAVFFVFS